MSAVASQVHTCRADDANHLVRGGSRQTRPRLGLVLEHYDGRNDVREFVAQLATQCDLVLFGTGKALCNAVGPFEKRQFKSRPSIGGRLWTQGFNLFGRIPRSHENFLVTEAFKLSALPPWHRRAAEARLRMRIALPRPMSFDVLLDRLAGDDQTPIDDIDRFLVITELTSPAFLARVLAAGKPVDSYVYSWDHPCKHARISARIDRWFVWHDGIAEDMQVLQGVAADRLQAVGSTQLCYVQEYLARPELRVPRRNDRYMYYGCGTGNPVMAKQEAVLIGLMADALQQVDVSIRLLVRPYPFLQSTEFFALLRTKPNVEFDDAYRVSRTDHSLRRTDIFERMNLQEHALAFAHCGTTMGLEGAYLPAPVLFLDLREVDFGIGDRHFLHLRKFIGQYHNTKYMARTGFPNVIRRAEDLRPTLEAILREPEAYRRYNAAIARQTPLRTMEEIVNSVVAESGDRSALRT